MYRIALNVAISSYRKKNKDMSTISLDENKTEIADKTEQHDSTAENSVLLQQFINELNTMDRALMLLYIDGKSYGEIADILGITETNTSNSWRSRSVSTRSARGFKNGATREHIAQSASEHFQLLDALSKQDEAGAVAVMRRHLERSRHVWGEGDNTAHT